MPRLTVIALIAVLALPAVARGDTVSDSSGNVSATVSYTKADDFRFRDLKLSVIRAGTTYDLPWPTNECGDAANPCGPELLPHRKPVQVRDLDSDGEPEVIVDLYSGGAHCCSVAEVYGFIAGTYVLNAHSFFDAGFTLRDLNGDGRLEFVSADTRFAYRFASFASSGMPIQVWSFTHGLFQDITRGFKPQLRADSKRWWRYWRTWQRSRGRPEALGALAAWAGDEYLLGHRNAALRRLRSLARRGQLHGSSFVRGGRRFVTTLDRFLERYGY